MRSLNEQFWIARVRLNQAPTRQEVEVINNIQTRVKIEKTWMRNYFQDHTVYGLQLTSLGNMIRWEFYVKELKQKQAIIRGNLLLKCLKKEFPGLSGEDQAISIKTGDLFNGDLLLYEIKFPELSNSAQISLIREFIQNNRENSNKKHILKLYILWQEDDSITNNFIKRPNASEFGEFKIKVFVSIEFIEKAPSYTEREGALLNAELEYLKLNILNLKKERATLKKATPDTWKRILNGNIFWKNQNQIKTGRRYQYIKHKIPPSLIPSFVTPFNVDFNFPKYCGLPHSFILENENIIDLGVSENDNNFIWFGKTYRQGVLTENNAFFHVNDLSLSCIIAGATGTGKTRCASLIIDEINKKAPHIGVLTLGLSKKNQDVFFKSDKVFRIGKDDISIPYFIMPNSYHQIVGKYADETAEYLTASIGLKGAVKTSVYNTIMLYKEDIKMLPKTPTQLFEAVLDYLDDPTHKYHEKFHTNITTAIREVATERLCDPTLEKILRLEKNVPRWFREWRNGANIYLDLTEGSIWDKRIITFALLQMIKTLTAHLEEHRLHNLIIIDEAFHLLALSTSQNPRADEFIAKERLEFVFKEMLEEFRSRGLGFIIIDKAPSSLFKCVSKSPSLKILFRLDTECGRRFTLDLNELNYLKNQKKRHALFFNGATGEEFIIKTLNHKTSTF